MSMWIAISIGLACGALPLALERKFPKTPVWVWVIISTGVALSLLSIYLLAGRL